MFKCLASKHLVAKRLMSKHLASKRLAAKRLVSKRLAAKCLTSKRLVSKCLVSKQQRPNASHLNGCVETSEVQTSRIETASSKEWGPNGGVQT